MARHKGRSKRDGFSFDFVRLFRFKEVRKIDIESKIEGYTVQRVTLVRLLHFGYSDQFVWLAIAIISFSESHKTGK